MIRTFLLLLMLILAKNTVAQDGGGLYPPYGSVDISPVIKEGFSNLYIGKGLIAFDVLMTSNFDLRKDKYYPSAEQFPLDITISVRKGAMLYSLKHSVQISRNLFIKSLVSSSGDPGGGAGSQWIFKVRLPVFEIADGWNNATVLSNTKISVTVDPKGHLQYDYYASVLKKPLGYFAIYEMSTYASNNILSEIPKDRIKRLSLQSNNPVNQN
jgi:hypothetical protein